MAFKVGSSKVGGNQRLNGSSGAVTLANAGVATASGAANAAGPSVKPNAGVATSIGVANNPAANSRPNAGVATSTGTSNTAGKNVQPRPTTATGIGAANNVTGKVSANPGVATGVGTANNATGLSLQSLYPNVDISVTGWTTQAGGTSNLYATLDEVDADDDADYVTAVLV